MGPHHKPPKPHFDDSSDDFEKTVSDILTHHFPENQNEDKGTRASLSGEPTMSGSATVEFSRKIPTDRPEVKLAYKIEGNPTQVNIFELARILEGFGAIVCETNRIINKDAGEIVLDVRPFQQGSFLTEIVNTMQPVAGTLFFLGAPDVIHQIKLVYEHLGLIKRGAKAITTLMDVIKFLKDGKPAKVEQKSPDVVTYTNKAGQQMNVSPTVHNLVNNGTIQFNFYHTFAKPLEREGITAVKTFIPDEPDTIVETLKQDLPAIKAYSQPQPADPEEERLENITTEFLNPKAGSYGEAAGLLTFRKSGTRPNLKAKIMDKDFLSQFEKGDVRFYQGDVLKVELLERQTLKGDKAIVQYEIIKVLEYRKGKTLAAAY